MALASGAQRTGALTSGDATLFYRHFGQPGAAPVVILHGAAYYDSADWVAVAAALAGDREVVAYDARGYGASSWSPSRDYSLDAQLADLGALCDHLGWRAPVLLGHSRGGSYALRYAHAFPDRVGALVLADSCPGRTARGPAPAERPAGEVASPPRVDVFPTLADLLASTSRDPSSLERPDGVVRLEEFTAPVGGGYAIAARDPSFQNARPIDQPGWVSRHPPIDPWDALAALQVPALAIRATRSLAYDEAAVARLRAQAPRVDLVEIDSGHDLAAIAPQALIRAVRAFLDRL